MQEFFTLNTTDLAWLLLCGFLVALMQAGFTCLESGMVRAKNSINVAIKNLVDFCISILLFSLFGFGLMYGVSDSGLFGTSLFLVSEEMSFSMIAFFFYQAMFCGTATTIISGAVAERMRFGGYIIASVIIAGLIYPIVGHWAWNGVLTGEAAGWLGKLGFIDFAGSTVVHSVGGWMALAAILVIGPRIGRFGAEGRKIEGHSLPIAALGVFLLWFGWFGFNGGSAFALNEQVPLIIVNTAIAGAAGGLAATLITLYLTGKPTVDRVMNGIIAGLVAITASAHLMSPLMSMLIGAIGGTVCVFGMLYLEKKQIDDAIGVVPTHLFAGIWGTLAVALAPESLLANDMSRGDVFFVQLLGVTVIGIYTFVIGYGLLRLVNHWYPLRVSANDERIGLNISEHDAGTSILDLITQMDQQARSGDYSRPIDVEPETEAAHIAMFYNGVLEGFNTETGRRQMAIAKLSQLANNDPMTGLANRRVYFDAIKRALSRVKRKQSKGAVLYMDLDGFKRVNDRFGHEMGDTLLKAISLRMIKCVRETDLLARVGGDEFGLLLEDITGQDQVKIIADKIIEVVSAPVEIGKHRIRVGISIGIQMFLADHDETQASIVKKADHAMYTVKLAGKNNYRFYTETDEELVTSI